LSDQPTTATSLSTSISLNRGCIIGITAVSVIFLLCVGVLAFVVLQYRSSLTVYQWEQNANAGDASNQRNEYVCPESQAQRFGQLLYARYTRDIEININSVDETDAQVHVKGHITIQGNESDYEAILHIKNGGVGFLGVMGCVERIEQLQPDLIPPPSFVGG
jgi:hypothetical protein